MRFGKLMKDAYILAFIVLVVILALTACSKSPALGEVSTSSSTMPLSHSTAQIYLYGEQHGVEKILDKEFELWYEHYHNENMKHLFVELPYYTAEFLNMWMQSDNDDILDEIFDDWKGTASHNPYSKAFYQKIKRECPQTVFHGTDVGHQYSNTGERFMNQLQESKLEDSEQYQFAQKVIEQGKYYYENSDEAYRENMMSENFIYEFDKLSGESIMGIYGSAHTGLNSLNATNTVPSMANQLMKHYGDAIRSEDLSSLAKDIDPYRVDTIEVGGKDYKASYFGKQDMTGFKDFASREFWRLENAYDDFKDRPKTGDLLPYDNYPMLIEKEQVFIMDITKTDGSVIRTYYRSDGYVWRGNPSTEEFATE